MTSRSTQISRRTLFLKGVGILLLLLLMECLTGCTQLFFHPQREHALLPDTLGLAYQDVYFPSSDGLMLHGWFLPSTGGALGTVLFLHGNAENISTHIHSVHWLPNRGFNVFLVDYRGYGASQGKPDLEGVHHDVAGALNYMIESMRINPNTIVVFGQSLGASIAIHAVAYSPDRDKIKALVIEGAFSGYRRIFREKLAQFWLTWPLQWPLSFTVNDHYNPLDAVSQLGTVPLLVIQGEKDPLVPLSHGRLLFSAASAPKVLWIVPRGGHINTFARATYRDCLVKYLRNKLTGREQIDSQDGAGRLRAT